MIRLDAATVLLQWAAGGFFFLWVTTRRRTVGIGYGWLLRSVFAVLAVGAVAAGQALEPVPARDVAAAAAGTAGLVGLAVSVVRRKAGVSGEQSEKLRRSARVQAMLAPADETPPPGSGEAASSDTARRGVGAPMPGEEGGDGAPPGSGEAASNREFPPVLDLVAAVVALIGLVPAALDAGGPAPLAVTRTLSGALFLGAVTDAMLLGHWYLVQPGLGRQPLLELNRWLAWLWPVEVAALLWPTGMLSVLSGAVDDGWGGTLGWFWVACALTTLVLTIVTRAALQERSYSAVMAATGLLYLAILTAFGTDLVARAVLAA